MSKKLGYIILFILGIIVSWFLGYIKLPYLDVNYIFWYGFFGCLSITLFLITIFWLSNNKNVNQLFDFLFTSNKNSKTRPFLPFEILILILSIGLFLFCLTNYLNNNKLIQKLNTSQNELNEVKHQTNLQDQSGKISLLMDIIHKLDSTKVKDLDKIEKQLIVDRIVALSYSFKPFKIWTPETESYESLSRERGLFLLALVNLNLDSSYFNIIKSNVSFAYSDLRNVDLQDKNLSGLDLSYAHLEYANLQGVILDHAKLKYANMTGINLNKASLVDANLIGARMSWAKINEANMESARLDSSEITNSTLFKTSLKSATLIKTNLCNSILTGANLYNAFILGTNIANSNLSKSVLIKTEIAKTNLVGILLDSALIQKNWFEILKSSENIGTRIIIANYQIVSDSLQIKDSTIYHIKSIKNN